MVSANIVESPLRIHILAVKLTTSKVINIVGKLFQPCNRNKGSDLGSIPINSDELVRFYNPRVDNWHEHFQVNSNAEIIPLTEIGEVTAFILGFNEPERIAERLGLIEIGHYQI
jgi:hypothetical protein